MADEPTTVDEQAQDDYWRERYRVAREAGFDRSHARAFATSRAPMAELRHLIEHGCPIRLAERILAADT